MSGSGDSGKHKGQMSLSRQEMDRINLFNLPSADAENEGCATENELLLSPPIELAVTKVLHVLLAGEFARCRVIDDCIRKCVHW